MKPLTIDELRNLEVGDWVWLEYGGKGYFQVDECKSDNVFYVLQDDIVSTLAFETYGKTWLAYKNKEQAEGESRLQELRGEK